MKKLLIGLAIGSALAIFAQPYYTTYQLWNSYRSNDGETFTQHIDFPRLKHHIAQEMTTTLNQELSKSPGIASDIAALASERAINMALKKMVNPTAVADAVSSRTPQTSDNTGDDIEIDSFRAFYSTPARFDITVKTTHSDTFIVHLTRVGLPWKVTGISIR